jgi:hypothetical protein
MTPRERDELIEQAASAWRPRTRDGGARAHPAWHDLDGAGREAAFEVAREQRRMEAAMDPEGLSTTGRRVLQTIRGAR